MIAAGRASEILDLGGGRVLRRFKNGGDPEREAGIMAHARAHGFPVPEVLEVRDDALVLERIDGPSMLRMLRTRPWRVGEYDEETAKEEPSRVTWELEPQDGGVTKLTVVHDRLEAAPKTAENVAGGWSFILSGLKTLLETGEPLVA